MIREVFRIGPLSISPFGLMMVVAFFAAFVQARRNLKRLGIGDEEDAGAMLLAAALGGIVGAKVYYAILYGDPRLLLERYGLVWYGGFALGAAAVLWTVYRRRLPPWSTADAVAPCLPLGYAIGRIGCFLVGDDYGAPTDLPWGVTFPVGLPPTRAAYLESEFGVEMPPGTPPDALVAVHPTQLYEAAAGLGIWAFGLWLLGRGERRGTVALATVALLGVERLAIEFLRAKDDRLLGGFTVAQAISLAVVVAAAALWSLRPRRTTARAQT